MMTMKCKGKCMTAKQIGILLILGASIVFPIIIFCLFLGVVFSGWEGSILSKLIKELE